MSSSFHSLYRSPNPTGALSSTHERGELIAKLVTSPHASASIVSKSTGDLKQIKGLVGVLFSEDLGSGNRMLPQRPDECLLAESAVHFHGQPVAVVIGLTEAVCNEAMSAVRVEYHPSPPILTLEHAQEMQSHHDDAVTIARGDAARGLAGAPYRIEGDIEIGSQLPLPAEGLWARASFHDDGRVFVRTPAELPSRVRSAVAQVVGTPESLVDVRPTHLSGLVGGRQLETEMIASLAAVCSQVCGATVLLKTDRRTDAALTAKRHATRASFRAGFDAEGVITAAEIDFSVDGGYARGDSPAALDQMLLHADSAYFIRDFRLTGRLCRTNRVTGAALPAEGAAQGALVMEEIIARVAHYTGLAPDVVRALNFYTEHSEQHSTHYGQPVDCSVLPSLWRDLLERSDFLARRQEIVQWNSLNPCYKRGIAAIPMKFGIGDPRSERNQAMATVQVFPDGSVTVQAGCVEIGDGLIFRLADEVTRQFGIPAEQVNVVTGDLGGTPTVTARLGADGVGLMGAAVAEACVALKQRLNPIAAQSLAAGGIREVDPETIRYAGGQISSGGHAGAGLTFREVVATAWRRRSNMTAIGYHRAPSLWWDREVGAGWPFSAFVFGAAVVEVQLDAFTGETQVLRADLAHQGGRLAQIETDRAAISRAFTYGLGWMLNESVDWKESGSLLRATAGDYPIPGFSDAPLVLYIDVIPAPGTPAGNVPASGAESAVALAAAAREAVREAILAFGPGADRRVETRVPVPASPTAVLESLRDMSRQIAELKAAGPGAGL